MSPHQIDVAALRAATNIVELIRSYLPLKKTGKDYVACCPFHDEKTPSFTVSAQKHFYHCFGCGAHGDVVEFVRQYEGAGFRQAVESVARFVGFDLGIDDGTGEAAILQARRAAEARRIEQTMVIKAGVLAWSLNPATPPKPCDLPYITQAAQTMRKAIPAMYDIHGPRSTEHWPDEHEAAQEAAILWRGLLNRYTERTSGAAIRAARPEACRYPLDPPEREILAARRVMDWLNPRYTAP